MAAVLMTCPECGDEARLGIELDSQMLNRFRQGVHVFCDSCLRYQQMLPETLAACRAALRNRLQISMNLAFGSALASIGLTIPTIAVASIWLEGPLLLGLGPTQMVLLALTVVVAALTVVPGRATRLQGVVHLVMLAGFLFLAVNP